MANKFIILIICTICCFMASHAVSPQIKPSAFLPVSGCPPLPEHILRCLPQYACQHAIRLDLRCLLSISGTPLLGGLLGGTGGNGGGLLGGPGLAGGLLGR